MNIESERVSMNRIKEIRQEKKISQKKTANKANMSERYFQDVERNKSVPTVYKAIEIAKALDTTVEALFQ